MKPANGGMLRVCCKLVFTVLSVTVSYHEHCSYVQELCDDVAYTICQMFVLGGDSFLLIYV